MDKMIHPNNMLPNIGYDRCMAGGMAGAKSVFQQHQSTSSSSCNNIPESAFSQQLRM
jgi:hypothetical protein